MNRRARRTIGLTLIEMMIVVGIIALMVGFGSPAIRALVNSFQSQGGAVSMVNAALGSARAMAVSHQRYVGVRFQKLCTSTDAANPLRGLMDAPQYMIFIVHEEVANNGGLAGGFRAMEGLEPIKLPGTTGLMELTWIVDDAGIDEPAELSDATTFSIVFSPSGKLIVHDVWVRNQDGVRRPDNAGSDKSMDDIFNSPENICNLQQGMFIQDDYSKRKNSDQTDGIEYGLGREPSRTSLVIYEPSKLRTAYEKKTAWADYLNTSAVKTFYVSPYTGDLISSD